jgi:zona occludens toxin
MINLITGLPGSGKTLYTLTTVSAYVEKENKALLAQGKPPREVYYHGIPELTLAGWHLMESPEDWIKLPSHSIIVIDECQTTFRPRAASVKPPLYVSEFETHRHKGLDFFLLTQHPMLVDGNIRRLAGKHYHVVRFYGFQKSTIHEFQSVRDNVDKNTKNSIATHFIFPKEVFNWYKSADAHTMKKRIPMRMVMVVVLPILVVVAGYFGVQALNHIQSDPQKAMQDKMEGKTTNAQGETVQQSRQAAQLTYIQSRTPEVPNLPLSAPAYQKVIEPITAPYPAACVASKSKGCQCFTQQGTKFVTDPITCQNIVDNGFFIDWKTTKEASNSDNKGYGEHPHVDQQSNNVNEVDTRYVKLDLPLR